MHKMSRIRTTEKRVAEIKAEATSERIRISDVIDFIDLCKEANLPAETWVSTIGSTQLHALRAETDVLVADTAEDN